MPYGNSSRPVTFRIQNIGPVKDAKLELGDLTIIAGRNNTGKTYIVYTLYGFLKMWSGFPPWLVTEDPNKLPKESGFPNWNQVGRQLAEGGHVTFALDKIMLDRQRRWVIPILTQAFSDQALSEAFSSQQSAFQNASIEIACSGEMPNPPRSAKIKAARGHPSYSFSYDGNDVTVTVDEIPPQFPTDVLSDQLAYYYTGFLLEGLFPDPFILSAERFGISLFYKELDFTKNQLVDLLQKMGDDKNRDRVSPYFIIDRATSRYALPIKDNIDYTRSIPERRGDKSEIQRDKLFNNIKDMMDGYYQASGDALRFRSKARAKERSFNIPLYLASSSARGLSDLYFFLQHAAKLGQLLIIDEPESHLDTANQILLARLLARFVHAGLKVLITTHSDYIVKEVNNLVMLSRPFPGKAAVAKRLGYGASEWISPDSIRGYVTQDGALTRCTVDSLGINMPVFDETIDEINKVANELSAYVSS